MSTYKELIYYISIILLVILLHRFILNIKLLTKSFVNDSMARYSPGHDPTYLQLSFTPGQSSSNVFCQSMYLSVHYIFIIVSLLISPLFWVPFIRTALNTDREKFRFHTKRFRSPFSFSRTLFRTSNSLIATQVFLQSPTRCLFLYSLPLHSLL